VVKANVVYMINGQVENYPVIEGSYITLTTFADGRCTLTVRTKRHGHVVRSIHFKEIISVDREFSDDHYTSVS